MAAAECVAGGCGVVSWALAAADAIPGAGKALSVIGKFGGKILGGAMKLEKGALRKLAEQIRLAATHPAAANQRTIAVAVTKDGKMYAGSSNGFDRGQREMAEMLGIECVSCKKGAHAEENLLREVDDMERVGTSERAPCGPGEHNCLGQLEERGIEIDNDL
jgi:hypothetical protein